jgi:hypothetical protein
MFVPLKADVQALREKCCRNTTATWFTGLSTLTLLSRVHCTSASTERINSDSNQGCQWGNVCVGIFRSRAGRNVKRQQWGDAPLGGQTAKWTAAVSSPLAKKHPTTSACLTIDSSMHRLYYLWLNILCTSRRKIPIKGMETTARLESCTSTVFCMCITLQFKWAWVWQAAVFLTRSSLSI